MIAARNALIARHEVSAQRETGCIFSLAQNLLFPACFPTGRGTFTPVGRRAEPALAALAREKSF